MEEIALDAETTPRSNISILTGLDIGHIRFCPAIAFDQIVGGRYKLHILCVLNLGPHRYGEIGRSLLRGTLARPITPRILSRELKQMEQRGLINREAYPVVPRKVVYSLTDRGRAMLPILREIVRWGATGAHEEILGLTADNTGSEASE
jgi:DNA-binding HxlR family transcriptional regulator